MNIHFRYNYDYANALEKGEMTKDGIIYIDRICKNQLFVGAIFNLKDEIHIKRK